MVTCFFVESLPDGDLVGLVLFRILMVAFEKGAAGHLQKERKEARQSDE